MKKTNLAIAALLLSFGFAASLHAGCCAGHKGVASCDKVKGVSICKDGTVSSCPCGKKKTEKKGEKKGAKAAGAATTTTPTTTTQPSTEKKKGSWWNFNKKPTKATTTTTKPSKASSEGKKSGCCSHHKGVAAGKCNKGKAVCNDGSTATSEHCTCS